MLVKELYLKGRFQNYLFLTEIHDICISLLYIYAICKYKIKKMDEIS